MIHRFFEQSWLYYKGQNSQFRFEEFLLLKISVPILTLIMYCLMASFGFQTNQLTYWVVGNAFLLCTSTCVFTIGVSFNGERYYGRLRSLIVSPSSKLTTVLQKGFFPGIESFFSVFLGFIIGGAIFHVNFHEVNMVFLIIIIIVAMFSASGFGMILSMLGMVSSEMHLLLNCASYVLAILSGANFPVVMLPSVIQRLTEIIPLTRSIRAVNLLFEGGDLTKIISLLIGEIILGFLFYMISVVLLKVSEKIAIKKGTIDIF